LFQQCRQATQQGFDLLRVEHRVIDLKRRRAGGHQGGVVFDELLNLLAAQTVVTLGATTRPLSAGFLPHGTGSFPLRPF